MNDQAELLRQRVMQKKQDSSKNTIISAVLSGKGGVGKSVFATNFALALNRAGKKTLLIDLDIGMGNIDILLRLPAGRHFADFIKNRRPIRECITETADGLHVIPAGSGLGQVFELSEDDWYHFITEFRLLKNEFDFILFDLGAGMTRETISFLSAVHEILLVTTPEPTSLTDAYAAVKTIHRYTPEIPVKCVINRSDSEVEAKGAWDKISGVSERFLLKKLDLIGFVPRDRAVVQAVKYQKPFVVTDPASQAAKAIDTIVRRYTTGDAGEVFRFDGFVNKIKRFFTKG